MKETEITYTKQQAVIIGVAMLAGTIGGVLIILALAAAGSGYF